MRAPLESVELPIRVKDVMTLDVVTIRETDTLRTAANYMRIRSIGDLVVLDEGGALVGIITDRDIVVRGLASGAEPATARVGEFCSREIETLSPEDTLDDAVARMGERAVRRIPVVERGDVVGILSLGDLAQARAADSTLGQISGAPPNT